MSVEEAQHCLSGVLEDLAGAAEAALEAYDSEHDYLRICGEVAYALATVLQAPLFLHLCQQYCSSRRHTPPSLEARPDVVAPPSSWLQLHGPRLAAHSGAAQTAAFLLLAAEEYLLEQLSEADDPSALAAASAQLVMGAARAAPQQAPERSARIALTAAEQMASPLLRSLPDSSGQVGTAGLCCSCTAC